MDKIEGLVQHFYDRYNSVTGEIITPDGIQHSYNIDCMWRAFKRCSYNQDEVIKRIGIFLNSPGIELRDIKLFASDRIQSMLHLASERNEDSITFDFTKRKPQREKIELGF